MRNGHRVPLGDENVLELDSSGDCTTMDGPINATKLYPLNG